MGIPLSARGGPLRPGIVHRLDAGRAGCSWWRATIRPTRRSRRCSRHRRSVATSRSSAARCRTTVRGGCPARPGGREDPRGRHRRREASTVRGSRALPAGDAARGRTTYRTHAQIRAPVLDRAPDPGDRRYGGEGTTRASSGWNAPSCTRGGSRSTTRSPGSGSTWRIRCPRTWRRPSGGRGRSDPPDQRRARSASRRYRACWVRPRARRAGRPRRRGRASATRSGRSASSGPDQHLLPQAERLEDLAHLSSIGAVTCCARRSIAAPSEPKRRRYPCSSANALMSGTSSSNRRYAARVCRQPDPLVTISVTRGVGSPCAFSYWCRNNGHRAWYSHQSHSGF